MSTTNQSTFATSLLSWHAQIDRKLPWKDSNDPYKIWLSEIIMQQTRVAQGTPYYLKFIEAFPTIVDLANAEEGQVMKLWQGLGYYSRARNLHYTAKTVRDQYQGVFPNKYDDILALKGIGKYTAAAISSFAFGNEYPVVDGNVIRLISRFFGITEAIDTTPGLKKIHSLAEKLIQGSNPAHYNQAIMDFGALVCTPKSPNCQQCPFQDNCLAYKNDQIAIIPFKSKKIKKKTRYFHFLQITDQEGNTLLNYRAKKDIWQSLYDFPLIENDSAETILISQIKDFLINNFGCSIIDLKQPTKVYKHILSHQTLFGQFYKIQVDEITKDTNPFIRIKIEDMESYAFPVLISNYLKEEKNWTLF